MSMCSKAWYTTSGTGESRSRNWEGVKSSLKSVSVEHWRENSIPSYKSSVRVKEKCFLCSLCQNQFEVLTSPVETERYSSFGLSKGGWIFVLEWFVRTFFEHQLLIHTWLPTSDTYPSRSALGPRVAQWKGFFQNFLHITFRMFKSKIKLFSGEV